MNLKNLAIATLSTATTTMATITVAQAVQLNFSYTGASNTSGILTATLQSPGQYQVTSISGTRNGVNITGLVPPGTIPTGVIDPSNRNDNLVFLPPNQLVAGQFVGFRGLAYTVEGGNQYSLFLFRNFFTEQTLTYEGRPAGGGIAFNGEVALTITPAVTVPEPAFNLVNLGVVIALGSSSWLMNRKIG